MFFLIVHQHLPYFHVTWLTLPNNYNFPAFFFNTSISIVGLRYLPETSPGQALRSHDIHRAGGMTNSEGKIPGQARNDSMSIRRVCSMQSVTKAVGM